MRALFVALATLGAWTASGAEPLAVDLSDGWMFKRGDDPGWSADGFDDSGWERIKVGREWEEQGHADYDGFGWYRKRFVVPAALREEEGVGVEGLLLELGRIDDVDETWFNGRRVGGRGGLPPAYDPAWGAERKYRIEKSLVRWGDENEIAVRVYDGKAQGGMLGRTFQLRAPMLSDLVSLEPEWGDGDGVFGGTETAALRVSLRNSSSRDVKGRLTWTVADDEGERLGSEERGVSIGARSSVTLAQRIRAEAPGFFKVRCVFEPEGDEAELVLERLVGKSYESIRSPLTREDDFEAFWEETLRALARVEPEFQMERQAGRDSETHEVFEVGMRSLGGVRVRGWYERPKRAGGDRVPALLRVPGYSSSMWPTGDGAKMAYFSFNIRGHGNSQDDVPGEPANYWIRGLDDHQGYFYQGAYADCVRAVDFLVSREEIDPERIAVTGGSQGGGLSLATAALDPRIAACAPDIPFLCDWVKYFKASSWPEIDEWIAAKPVRTWETTLRTMSYFDALNLAERVRCPVLLSLGVQDAVCPASTIFSVYNRLAGEREFRAYAEVGHSVPAEHRALRRAWLMGKLGVE